MQRFRARNRALMPLLAILALAPALPGCGGEDNPADPGTGGGDAFTAKVDGRAWTAVPVSIVAGALPSIPGGYLVVGSDPEGSSSNTITISLYNVGGPGTYPFGVDFSVHGGRGSYGEEGNIWSTPTTGAAGTITITTLTATRMVATFHFTATPGHNNPLTNNRVITEGRFDVPLATTPPPLTDAYGKRNTATLNGASYTAASVSITTSGTPGFGFTSHNDDWRIEIGLEGVTQPGTYPLSRFHPTRTIGVGGYGGGISNPDCCYGVTDAATGSITITSITATRVKGTYTASLPATGLGPAIGTMNVASGSFDVGLADQ
jgi:hypothetical protein